MKPLDGARLKIVRAQQHLSALDAEIVAYVGTKPYIFPVEYDGITVIGRPAVVTSDPPAILSCLVGDCLTNLRASLDYVAYELAVRYGSPLTSRQEKGIQFPITGKSGKVHEAKGWGDLQSCNVPAAAMDEIERAQPYHAGNEAIGHLDALVKIDKHRLPLLTIGVAHTTSMKLYKVVNGIWTQLYRQSSGDFKTVITVDSTGAAANLQMHGEVATFVVFHDSSMPGGKIDETLSQIVNSVADIIPRFEPFFV